MVLGIDTAVIDDDLIAAAMPEAEGDAANGGTFELAQLVAETTTLTLSYKNILRVDHLHGFGKLTKLCLDNNVIERISNLDHLVNLTWLDLSFNNIMVIEGLGSLTKLTDLSLFNNQITEIEGFENCKALQCLSLGNNKISSLDKIIKLRQFPKLKSVNLEGNPVCQEAEYRFAVLAYLKVVKFHDYSMVDPKEVVQARETYQDELLELEEKETLEEEKEARDQASKKEMEQLRSANLLVVKTLFSDMFEADTEMARLKYLPGIEEIVEQFRNHVAGAADTFKAAGLQVSKKKEEQIHLLDAAVEELRRGYTSRAIQMIEVFTRLKKRSFAALASTEDLINPSDLDGLKEELEKLKIALLDLEMYQVEQHEALISEFETKFGQLRNRSLELQQTFFRAVEEHEESYFAAVGQMAQDMLEKAAKNELADDMMEELASLIIDRDTCMNSVVGSHDIHVGKLLAAEDEARAKEAKNMVDLVDGRIKAEHARNRARIMEIRVFKDANASQIQELLSSKLMEDDYEGDGRM